MNNEMKSILKSVDIDIVNSKKDNLTKLFGDGKVLGIMINGKARFLPLNQNRTNTNRDY